MSHLSKIFEEAPIRVQNRNGFDLSHVHAGTSKTGQLVPVLTKLLPPNSTISLGVNAEVNLPPLVAPFYGKVDFAIEGFVVPCSILYGGWKQFISNQDISQFPATQSGITSESPITVYDSAVPYRTDTNSWNRSGYDLPKFNLWTMLNDNTANFKTLASTNDNIYEYMGLHLNSVLPGTGYTNYPIEVSMLPGMAYHKICDTFYRNTKLTRTWFAVNANTNSYTSASWDTLSSILSKNVSLVWHSFYTVSNINTSGTGYDSQNIDTSSLFKTSSELTFPDGVSFFSTRQRQYTRDYFTSAVPSPQQGGYSSLSFQVGQNEGSFTINSLRAANALQKFLETNNLSGDFGDMIRNRWGVRPIDADFDEPHYLGRVVVPVYQHTIYQNTNQNDDVSYNTSNPYGSKGLLGSAGAVGRANAEGSICDHFNCSTWSYLMCIASLVPHANYNYGINRELTMTKLGDYPAPELQTIGMEDIKNYEIGGATSAYTYADFTGTFGYIPRYSRFKYIDDRVSGELIPGKTLDMFQLQRNFRAGTGIPKLGTDFVTIAQSDLDNVLTVNTSTMNLTCWWEIFFNLKVVMPLADFCIPTLGELMDTHTIKTTVGGSRL